MNNYEIYQQIQILDYMLKNPDDCLPAEELELIEKDREVRQQTINSKPGHNITFSLAQNNYKISKTYNNWIAIRKKYCQDISKSFNFQNSVAPVNDQNGIGAL